MKIDITDKGAVGDGQFDNTTLIQKAVDACAAQGGGTVIIPQGDFRSGTIHLKSNVTLYLEKGAMLRAMGVLEKFPAIGLWPHKGAVKTDSETGELFREDGNIHAFIHAHGAKRIAIRGEGFVDGGGNSADFGPEFEGDGKESPDRLQLSLIHFSQCRHVSLNGITLQNSRFWTTHLDRCVDCFIHGITIWNPLFSEPHRMPNSDGIDPDGCRNVIISDCRIHSNDDCICVKSTFGEPAENITVTNCILETDCYALKLGTESSGDIRNVNFHNCQVRSPSAGLYVSLRDGGTFSGLIVSDCQFDIGSHYAIEVDISPRNYKRPKIGNAFLENVILRNLIVRSPKRMRVEGRPGNRIKRMLIDNVLWKITAPLGEIDGLVRNPNWIESIYDPEYATTMNHPCLAGFMHVDGLRITNFHACYENGLKPDRELFRLVDCPDAVIRDCSIE
jgi:polygalacturonase